MVLLKHGVSEEAEHLPNCHGVGHDDLTNDQTYHFIPAGEIWIDGQISCEETEYSIAEEQIERNAMKAGKNFSDAYSLAIDDNTRRRDLMETLIRKHPPLILPDSTTRYAGEIDPQEK